MATFSTSSHPAKGLVGLGKNEREIIKSFIGQKPFYGNYDKDLEQTIGIYQDLCDMCYVTPLQKRRDMMIMLSGEARAYYM